MRVSWQPMIKILFESRAPATVVCPPLVPGEKSTNSTRTTRVNSEWFWRVMLLDESPMNSGTQSFESVSFFSFLMKNSTARKERSIKMKNSTNFGTCKNLSSQYFPSIKKVKWKENPEVKTKSWLFVEQFSDLQRQGWCFCKIRVFLSERNQNFSLIERYSNWLWNVKDSGN